MEQKKLNDREYGILLMLGLVIIGMFICNLSAEKKNLELQGNINSSEFNKEVWMNQTHICWDEIDICNQSYNIKSQELETIKHVMTTFCDCDCDNDAISTYLYGDDLK